MSDLGDYLPREQVHAFIAGTVAAPAPASTADLLYVTVAEFDGSTATWGPYRWPQVYGTTLPAEGDEVLLGTTLDGDRWLLTWR